VYVCMCVLRVLCVCVYIYLVCTHAYALYAGTRRTEIPSYVYICIVSHN
jgi:hypothetical protein